MKENLGDKGHKIQMLAKFTVLEKTKVFMS